MTTWTLSELGCTGECDQGCKPCTCKVKANDCPVVIVDSGASVEPIPFWGVIDFGDTNGRD
jgi:hypothetical protein